MLSDRPHYPAPTILAVRLICLLERLVHIRYGCDQRRSFMDGPPQRDPIKRVPPAVVLVSGAAGLFEDIEKMQRPLVIQLLAKSLREEEKSHRIIGVGNGKPLRAPEQRSGSRNKCLAENDWGYHQHSPERLPVIESLGPPPEGARVERLKIVGVLSIPIEPLGESQNAFQQLLIGG